MSLGFPIWQSEQALTAARPPRTLTAFPFDYPEAQSFRTCSQVISFSKSNLSGFYQAILYSSSKK
jgi:hypothetical protein